MFLDRARVLQELRLVERRVPATVPPNLQHRSKQGRYHLLDPFHRFYFRFLRPNQAEIAYQPDRVLERIQSGLHAFVGQTAWEELARSWVHRQGLGGALGWVPEVMTLDASARSAIGSHWDRSVQADVVAVSWRERVVLVGECKWGEAAVSRQELRTLLEHTLPRTLKALPQDGASWRAIPALFAWMGATPDAAALLRDQSGLLVDLPTLICRPRPVVFGAAGRQPGAFAQPRCYTEFQHGVPLMEASDDEHHDRYRRDHRADRRRQGAGAARVRSRPHEVGGLTR